MSDDSQEVLAVLQQNVGFDRPARWLDYARRHGFQRVEAVKVDRCPDCGGDPGRFWGQYVYYSTLVRLCECTKCELIWADAHIDPRVLRAHFERAYKEEEYFGDARAAIYRHLARVIGSVAPAGARVLDIGGARGDLMHQVVLHRPDLRVTVHDISRAATAWATTNFGFATLLGDADELASRSEQYEVVILSDVLYYEPKLTVLWTALSRLICRGGAIVIRVPNKLLLMRLGQLWLRISQMKERRLLQDHVPFFNPEHVFVFRGRYLRRRLKSIGFTQVRIGPSPLLKGPIPDVVGSSVFRLASTANRVSLGSLVLTPGMLVVGTGRDSSRTV